MGKCAKDIKDFHNQKVKLSKESRDDIFDKAKSNQDRIKDGLAKNDDPKPRGFCTQGSYAMGTMIQHPQNDYDVDAGCYFNADKVSEISASEMRKKIQAAAELAQFKTPPEARDNCVRIYYEAGYHVDVPVYQTEKDEDGNDVVKMASGDKWRDDSDPRRVVRWFQGEAENKPSLKKAVRLMKAFCKESKPSGLVLSVLLCEIFILDGEDDDMFHKAMQQVKLRLDSDRSVYLFGEECLEPKTSTVMSKFCGRLEGALDTLKVLDNPLSSRGEQLKAWKQVFDCDFFDDAIAKEEEGGKSGNGHGGSGCESAFPVMPASTVVNPHKPWLRQ